MLRQIIGFYQDEESHWVAGLNCGHSQHTRHDPPFFPRPWVLTEAGRKSHLGKSLNCVRCDRQELPEHFVAYRQTPVFTPDTMPCGLKRNHSTKEGVWGIIHVIHGMLRYRIDEPFNTQDMLYPDRPGIVIPEVEHSVHPFENAEFWIEFWRSNPTDCKLRSGQPEASG